MTKVAILEWICGGGLLGNDLHTVSNSLLGEGRAMLVSLANGFAECNCQPIISLDARLREDLNGQLHPSVDARFANSLDGSIPANWLTIADDADLIIAIAPELDNKLEQVLDRLSRWYEKLCNCSGEFLKSSCDKWQTAQQLRKYNLPHPPTSLLTDPFLQVNEANYSWVVKPRDGAGCEGIRILDQAALQDFQSKVVHEAWRWLVQPWVDGRAYSRSAIVDRAGNFHWLSLITQELHVTDKVHYLGGLLPALHPSGREFSCTELNQLDTLLSATMKALGPGSLGWVGVDLLFDTSGQWQVIEVNPRLTTSFIALNQAAELGITQQFLSLFFRDYSPTYQPASLKLRF